MAKKLEIQLTPIAAIEEDPNQPRKTFEQEALEELAANIEDTAAGSDQPWVEGLLHPIVIYPNPAHQAGTRDAAPFRVLVGARRLRAYRLRAWPVIPARVVRSPASAARSILTQINENAGREGTSLYEEASAVAMAFEAWQAEHPGGTQRQFAEAFQRSVYWVSRRLGVARATGVALQALREGYLGHPEVYRLFCRLSIGEQRQLLADARRWDIPISAKQARHAARARKAAAPEPARKSPPVAKPAKAEEPGGAPKAAPEPAEPAAPAPRGKKGSRIVLRLTAGQLRRILQALDAAVPDADGELEDALRQALETRAA